MLHRPKLFQALAGSRVTGRYIKSPVQKQIAGSSGTVFIHSVGQIRGLKSKSRGEEGESSRSSSYRFVDETKIVVNGGKGGSGCISYEVIRYLLLFRIHCRWVESDSFMVSRIGTDDVTVASLNAHSQS